MLPCGLYCLVQDMGDTMGYTGTLSEQSGNDADPGLPPIGEDVLSTSLDKGMMPVYDLTKFFLDKIIAVHTLTDLNGKVSPTFNLIVTQRYSQQNHS